MSETNCKTVRKEIEELALDQSYGQLTRTHLGQCESCRVFHKEQTSLRELVQSLGTVTAPADFDFKLRARLANGAGRSRPFSVGLHWSLNPLLASAAAVLLFVGAIVAISYVNKQSSSTSVAAVDEKVPPPAPTEAAIPKPAESDHQPAVQQNNGSKDVLATVGQEPRGSQKRRGTTAGALRPSRQVVSADFSATGAPTFGAANQLSTSRVFPIDGSLQSLKVSLDDSRGNARTISLPGVSFGAQRVLASSNQKGIW